MTEELNTPFIFDFVEETEKTIEEVQSEEDSGSCEG